MPNDSAQFSHAASTTSSASVDEPRIVFTFVGRCNRFFQGCASPADPERMVPTDAVVRKTHSATVDVAVIGGTQTNPLWVSKVSNEDFRKAVETSLLRYGVFSRVIQNQGTDYRLDVELKQLKQPFAGFNMTVTSKVHWRLSNSKTGRIVWQQDIDRRFTAKLGDAFYGVHRLELANEGAIRENIKTAVQELGQLSF